MSMRLLDDPQKTLKGADEKANKAMYDAFVAEIQKDVIDTESSLLIYSINFIDKSFNFKGKLNGAMVTSEDVIVDTGVFHFVH
jgi:hypothetical protein